MAQFITVHQRRSQFLLWVGKFEPHRDGFIMIGQDDCPHDSEYKKDLAQMHSDLRYYQANAYLTEWFSSNPPDYNFNWDLDHYLLDLIDARDYKILEVNQDLYNIVLSLRENNPNLPRTRPVSQVLEGYVYVMQHTSGLVKIGYSKDPDKRLKQVTRDEGNDMIELLCVIKSDHMTSLEYELHQRFRSKRIRGEWFDLPSKDIEYIKGLTNANNL